MFTELWADKRMGEFGEDLDTVFKVVESALGNVSHFRSSL